MSDEKLQDLISTLPDDVEVAARAARARHRALAEFRRPKPARGWLPWAPAVAFAAMLLMVAGAVVRTGAPVAAAPAVAGTQQQESLRMKWVLSDGTRVLWTIHKNEEL